jgi:pimeloyl-ACP methyl ester carboxylesterase
MFALILLLACGESAPIDTSTAEVDTGEDPGDTAEIEDTDPVLPDVPELYSRLLAIEGLRILSTYAAAEDVTVVEIMLRQPVDHAAPDGPSFEQWMTLRHRSFEAPTVLEFSGYSNYWGPTELEAAFFLEGNQIAIEKRYYNVSRPEGEVDWSTFNAEQFAGDAHRVRELLGALYVGNWVSEGGSQGGLDALYHRLYYPDDVVGTVALSVPLMQSLEDPRAVDYFDDPVRADCQARLEEIRRLLLTPDFAGGLRESAVARSEAWFPDYTFERVGSRQADVGMYAVEFPWAFWQYYWEGACEALPDPVTAPADALSWGMSYYGADHSDQVLEESGQYWIHVSSQTGYPVVPLDGIEHLVDPEWPAYYELLPLGAEPQPYAPLEPAIQAWIDDEARNVLFLYGDVDPLARFPADVSDADASVRLFRQPDSNHNVWPSASEPEDWAVIAGVLADWAE